MAYIWLVSQPAPSFPDGVPLTVPDSWKRATLGAPVPVVRCTYIFPDQHARPGEQCKKWSLRGTNVCIKHGANLPVVKQHAEAVVESARLRLIDSTDAAVDYLLELAEQSASDAVRLKASTEILDRAGVRGGVELDVSVDNKQDPATLLRQRLDTLKARTIEGEVVASTTEPGDTVPDNTAATPHEEDTSGES